MTSMILFPSLPYDLSSCDPDYEAERKAAVAAGFRTCLFDLEALQGGDVVDALRRVPRGEPHRAIYRGWMMPTPVYRTFAGALAARGIELRTTPDAYQLCHELPSGYHLIENLTPRSVWIEAERIASPSSAVDFASSLFQGPVMVKDYVKSRKHEWLDACFIPDLADRANAERVVSNFLTRQGANLTGGIVFREFVPLEIVGTHPVSGLPLAREHRLFVVGGRILAHARYWDEADYSDSGVDPRILEAIAGIPNPFFSSDIARRSDTGEWIIVELGDGQVAGLPGSVNPEWFYSELFREVSA